MLLQIIYVIGFYVIAKKGFGFGDGTGPAEESKRTKRVRGWSRQIKLGGVHCLQYTVNCFQYNIFDLCRCESSNHF